MRLIVRKALNCVNRNTNNPSENIWDECTKMSKIRPSMESLNTDLFSVLYQNYQKFCFKKLARNPPLIGDISEVFSKFTKFPVAIVSGGGDKDQWVTWIGGWHTLTVNHEGCIVRATELYNKNIYVLQIGASLRYKLGQLCFITN